MIAAAINQLSPNKSSLIQKNGPIMRVISEESPLVNNLDWCCGKKHVQTLQDVFPPQLKVLKAADEIDEAELDLTEMLEEIPVDLSKDEFTLTELLNMKTLEIPFLVEKILPEKAITILAGDSDVGKSLIYTQLCQAIVQGDKEFLGLKLNPKYKRILILNSEDGPISIALRVKVQLSGKVLSNKESDAFKIITNGSEAALRIEKKLKEEPVDLVVIDAFADVFEDDINSSNAVRNFLQKFSDLISKYCCTVLFVHHIGKGRESQGANKSQMLGSVGIHGKARNVIFLSKDLNDSNLKFLKITKGNYVSEEVKKNPIPLRFNSKTLLHEVIQSKGIIDQMYAKALVEYPSKSSNTKQTRTEVLISQAIELRKQGLTLVEIGKKMGKNPSSISRYLKKTS